MGGFETTIKLLGSCLRHLLAERERWLAIVEDPTRIPAVVEETLRFDGPLLATMRRTTQAVELSGGPLGAFSIRCSAVCPRHRQAWRKAGYVVRVPGSGMVEPRKS